MEEPQNPTTSNGVENQTNVAEVPVDFKISPKRILKLKASAQIFNFNSKNDDLSILHIEECKNLEEAQGIIQNLNMKLFPNIFVFVIETKDEKFKELDKLQAEIIGKFNENHPLVLQISCGNSKTFYVKKNEKFEKFNFNFARETLINQLKQSIFTVESLFNILKLKDCSIIDADLSEITEFLKLPQVDQKLFTFSLNQQDELCLRLLKLFNVNFSQEIQTEMITAAISTNNFSIFLACFNKFSPDDFKKGEVEPMLSLNLKESAKNIFLASIEYKNFEVVKFLLKFSKAFMNFFNFKLWKSSWDLSINREYFEVCNELQNADFNFTENERNVKISTVTKYEEVLAKIANFQENILRDNFNEVKNFAENNPNLRLCYGNRQICALEWAIACKKVEISYFEKGILYVGRNANKNQLYGTFAHEMTHLALYLVYENKCLPYWKGDKARKAKWLEVVEETKKIFEKDPEGTENIIKWVFTCYDDGYVQNAELIVRVNDLLASFFDNQAKIQELRRVFFKLFDFYDNLTLPDLKPKRFRLKNLNKELGLLTKTHEDQVKLNLSSQVLIHSNVPHLSIFKLQHDLQQKSSNSFAFRFENIFITLKDFCEMNESNDQLIKSTEVKRVVIDASECTSEDLVKVSQKLRACVEYLVVVKKNSNFSLQGFQNICEVFEWENLRDESKEFLLKKRINFQKMSKKFSLLLPEAKITSEVLKDLYKNKTISINCYNSEKVSDIFIKRKLQNKNDAYESSLAEFIELLENHPKILISDMAGSGKTFILKKIRSKLVERFPNSFVIYENFRDVSVDLVNEKIKSFQSFVCEKFLKLESALDVAVFNHFYTENRVIVLLDGFDEISQVAREKAIELIKLHDHGKLLVTTRDYLEENLETSMNMTSFKLIPYTIEDQTQFIVEYWQTYTKFSIELIKKCADQLIVQLNLILSRSVVSFFGLPLILHIFVEFFKSDLSDEFDKVLDQTMKISHAYDELVKSKTNIWSSISNLKDSNFHFNSITLKYLYYFFALQQFFEKEGNDFFGINYIKDQWNLEEITKAGIIRLDQDGKVCFIHNTVAEYFVYDFTKFNLNHVNVEFKFLNEFVALLIHVLSDVRFKVVRFLLNETIHEVSTSSEGFKFLKNKLDEKLEKDQNVKEMMLTCQDESNYKLALFFSTSPSSLDVTQILSSFISDESKKSPAEIDFFFSHIFMINKEILKKVFLSADAIGFSCFCRLFVDFHKQILALFTVKKFTVEEKVLILLHNSENGENMLHFVVKNFQVKSLEEVCELLRNNIEVPDLRAMMLTKNKEGKNFLHCALLQNDERKFTIAFKFAFDALKISFMSQLLKDIKNVLILMFSRLTTDTFKTIIDEFSALLEDFYLEVDEKDENLIMFAISQNNLNLIQFLQVKFKEATYLFYLNNENLLQFALKRTKNVEILKFLLEFTSKNLNVEKIERILKNINENGNSVIFSAILTGNSEIFKNFFTFCEQHLQNQTFLEVIKTRKDGRSILEIAKESNIYETVEEETRKVLKVSDPVEIQYKIMKITDAIALKQTERFNEIRQKMCEKNFQIDSEFKKILMTENYKKVKLLAMDVDSYKFMWEILEMTFNHEEIKNFLSSSDDFRNNFLHDAASNTKSRDVFKFAWLKVEELFENREELKKSLLVKGKYERNALIQSITQQNENTFFFLFEQVFCKFFNIKEFVYESDDRNENLLHHLASYGSVSMLKFALEKLKKEFLPEDFQNFLKLKSKNGHNILDCAAEQNKNEKSVEFLIKFVEIELGSKEELKMRY